MKVLIASLIAAFSLAFASPVKAQDPNQQNPSKVVAEVNGTTLTLGDLEQKRGDSLFQARRQYYQAERKALDGLIDERLIEMQARKENVTPEKLVEEHVNSKIDRNITDEQAKAVYDSLQSDQPFDEVKEQIKKHLLDQRVAKAQGAYIKSLREQAKVSVTLQEPRMEVALNGAPIRGSKNAPVVIVEFADYQCPYCKQIEPQLERLKSEFGDKVAIAFKDFPLPMHKNAPKMSEAAACAGAQGKYWEFHDYLFKDVKEDNFSVDALKAEAKKLNLNAEQFDKCLDSDAHASEIKEAQAEGMRVGITGTPTLFINGRFLSGNVKYETLRDEVQQELSASSSQTRASAQR